LLLMNMNIAIIVDNRFPVSGQTMDDGRMTYDDGRWTHEV